MRWSRHKSTLRPPKRIAVAVGLFMASAALWGSGALAQLPACKVSADFDPGPTEYCEFFQVTATNSSGGDLSHQPVRFQLNAQTLANSDVLDPFVLGVKATQSNFSNEVDLLAQDAASASSAWWLEFETIPNGESRTATIYLGNEQQKRNQGILFSGADEVATTDHADFDISDNLTLEIELEFLEETAQTATIASHWLADEGYALSAQDVAGNLTLRAQVDDQTCDLTWDSSWTDTNQEFRVRFVADAGNDLFIDRKTAVDTWTNASACDTDVAALTAPAGPDFLTGTSLNDAIVRQVHLRNSSGTVLHHLYDANGLSETSASNPTYTGTVADAGPNSHAGVYTFTRDQSNLTIVVGPVTATSATVGPALSSTIVDVLGEPFDSTFLTPVAENTDSPVSQVFGQPANSALPGGLWWSIIFITIGLVIFIGIFWLWNNAIIGLLVMGAWLTFGMLSGFVPGWLLVLWGLAMFSAYWAERGAESA